MSYVAGTIIALLVIVITWGRYLLRKVRAESHASLPDWAKSAFGKQADELMDIFRNAAYGDDAIVATASALGHAAGETMQLIGLTHMSPVRVEWLFASDEGGTTARLAGTAPDASGYQLFLLILHLVNRGYEVRLVDFSIGQRDLVELEWRLRDMNGFEMELTLAVEDLSGVLLD